MAARQHFHTTDCILYRTHVRLCYSTMLFFSTCFSHILLTHTAQLIHAAAASFLHFGCIINSVVWQLNTTRPPGPPAKRKSARCECELCRTKHNTKCAHCERTICNWTCAIIVTTIATTKTGESGGGGIRPHYFPREWVMRSW